MGQDESLEEVKCPECKSSKMVDDLSLGEIVCKNCGLVISEKEFAPGFSGERRMFSTEEILEASRVGPPIDPSRVDKGLSTEISYSDIAKLKSISPEQRGTLKRMSQIHDRVSYVESSKKSRLIGAYQLRRLHEGLINVPYNTKRLSFIILDKAIQQGVTRGRNLNITVAGAFYTAAQFTGYQKLIRDLEKLTGFEKKYIYKAHRDIINEVYPDSKPDPKSYSHSALYSQVAESRVLKKEEIVLPHEVRTISMRLIDEYAKRGGVPGKDRKGTIASAIYITCKELGYKGVSQSLLSEASGVTDATIRNRNKDIREVLGEELLSNIFSKSSNVNS